MIEHNGTLYKNEEAIAKANGITPRYFYGSTTAHKRCLELGLIPDSKET